MEHRTRRPHFRRSVRGRRAGLAVATLITITLPAGGVGCGGPTHRDDRPHEDTTTTGGPADPTSGAASADATEASSVDSTAASVTNASSGTGDATGVDTGSVPPVALCSEIAIGLVVDPHAPMYGASERAALSQFFDAIVHESGATLRIHPAVGAELGFSHTCLDAAGPAVDGPDLLWGSDFAVHDGAQAVLDCVLDAAHAFTSDATDGDLMFSGLMFPMLERPDWPPPSADLTAAILLVQIDDDQNNMYGRPGMAAEAFLRIAGGDDRRRVAAFAMGSSADELHTFTLSLNDASAYFDWTEIELQAALEIWAPTLLTACAEHRTDPPPAPLGGCESIDILFVIDGSASMNEEQDALRGTDGQPPIFADFVDALLTALDGLQDVHVGVISSQPGDIVLHRHSDMPAEPPTDLTDCGLPEAERWITAPNPDLAELFACVGSTRASQTDEWTAENAAQALTHPDNAGFLRDDSVLVVVLLTDEDTQGTTWGRAEVHQMIMDAVGGDRSRVVVLGIAGDQGVFEMPKTTCYGPYGSASPGRRLTSIVRTFRDHGRTQDICDGDFAVIFEQALTDVVDVCEDFHPEG